MCRRYDFCSTSDSSDTLFARDGYAGTSGRWQQATIRQRGGIDPTIESILALLMELDYSECDCMQVRVAVEEALVNGFLHGNRDDSAKCVRVRYLADHAQFLVEVEDEGPGFDPRQIPDPTVSPNLDRPTGRGLMLMQHCMTWVRFTGRGNRVTLCKHRSANTGVSAHAG